MSIIIAIFAGITAAMAYRIGYNRAKNEMIHVIMMMLMDKEE